MSPVMSPFPIRGKMKVHLKCKNEPPEPCSLLRSKLSCVEGKRSIRMRELAVSIGNSGYDV